MKRARNATLAVVLAIASFIGTEAMAAVQCKHVDTETSSGARYIANEEQLRDAATHAELSRSVYGCDWECQRFQGRWERWDILFDSRERTPGDPGGFHATAYEKQDRSAVVVAFEGTGSIEDWTTNVGMVMLKQEQFLAAEGFTRAVIGRACKSDDACRRRISVTGHSLGGALAQHVGLKYGLRTFTFNAAGLFRPSETELAAAGRLGYLGKHFFSQAYRLGSEYGADVVPYLGRRLAQETCEVPVRLPVWAWEAVSVELLTHSITGLSLALINEYDSQCHIAILRIDADREVCGIGLTMEGELTVDDQTVAGSRNAMTGYLSSSAGSRPRPASRVVVSMASLDGRFRLISPSSDSLDLGVEFVLNVPARTLARVEMGRYGSSVLAWSAENLAVVQAVVDGLDGVWVLDAAAGRSTPVFATRMGFIQREKTQWINGRTLTVPNLPCGAYNFDHSRCWDAAVRRGFPVWTVQLDEVGRVLERATSLPASSLRQNVRIGIIQDSSRVGGCGCTFNPVLTDGRVARDRFVFSSDFGCNAYMNLDGEDVPLQAASRLSQGFLLSGEECPRQPMTYLGGGYSVRLSPTETKRCPPEPTECEVTEYDAVIAVEHDDRRTVVLAKGQCGC